MTAVPGRLRLTVLGCSTALPAPDAAAAGFLVESDDTAILLDVGQGVANRLGRVADARELAGVVIGHMHADHFLDLAGLRYLFPWAGRGSSRLPVHLPPGGTSRLDELASAISERAGFFDDAYAVDEYDPSATMTIGPLQIRFAAGPPLRAGVGCLDRGARRGSAGLHRGYGTQSGDGRIRPRRRRAPGRGDPQRRLGGRRRAGSPDGRGGDRPGTGCPGRGRIPGPLPAGSPGGAGSTVRGGRPVDQGRPSPG